MPEVGDVGGRLLRPGPIGEGSESGERQKEHISRAGAGTGTAAGTAAPARADSQRHRGIRALADAAQPAFGRCGAGKAVAL